MAIRASEITFPDSTRKLQILTKIPKNQTNKFSKNSNSKIVKAMKSQFTAFILTILEQSNTSE